MILNGATIDKQNNTRYYASEEQALEMAKLCFTLENDSGLGEDMGIYNAYRASNTWGGEWQKHSRNGRLEGTNAIRNFFSHIIDLKTNGGGIRSNTTMLVSPPM